MSHIVDQFIECRPFDLLPFQITERVAEKVEDHTTLPQLLYEEIFPL